ncbi:MAG: CocE/NonD family hydrolase, partial [Acidobacteriia bacterium]|nr:CocE/NonD family hydrolase [Terriglobia bacterium]
RGDGKLPKAWVFETGVNQWGRFDCWPPKEAKNAGLFLEERGKISRTRPSTERWEEYVSDPAKPVPYIGHVLMGMRYDYMTEDQRFAATRPDVLVFKTEPLDHDVTAAGPIAVDLKVSTSGTDSDFDVKLIDVYPADYPDSVANPSEPGAPVAARSLPANAVHLGGYQQLVRGEPFRGKYRKGLEKGVPFVPGRPERIAFQMPDILHTFRTGHRIMVQIQSSWFPLTDRNPQTFVNIANAKSTDFVKAAERVYLGGPQGSRVDILVLE